MSIVTFTGPIKAGDVLNTTGTTAGTIKNVGWVVMAQTNNTLLTQAGTTTATATNLVIPANSHIVNIQALVYTVFGTTTTLDVGTTSAANELVVGASTAAVGLVAMTPGTDLARTTKWSNIGTSDVIIYVKSGSGTGGTFDLIVRYIQAENA